MTYKEQLNEFKSQDRLNHVEIAIALEVESYFDNASDDEFESICSYIKRIYLKYGHAEISQLVYCFASLFGNGKSINEILEISSRNFIDEAYATWKGNIKVLRGVLIDVVNNVGNVVEINNRLVYLEKEERLEAKVKNRMMAIPNIIANDVPIGEDDSKNVERKKYGEP